MRVLVSSSSGAGHFGPLIPFVQALQNRGDEVLLAVPPARRQQAEALGGPVLPLPDPPKEAVDEIWERVRSGQPASVDREIFAGLNTTAYLPVLERACHEWQPDVLMHEAAEFAAPIVAQRNGIRHVQVAIGLASVESGALGAVAPALDERLIGVSEAIRASPYFARLPASIDPSPYPDTRRVRIGDYPEKISGEGIFVSFGTIVSSLPSAAEVYRETLAALGDLPVTAVLTSGGADLALDPVPANVTVARWVDQDALIAGARVVVCHGGAGTTFGALASGVPVVVVPFMADQPVNGRIVTEAGCGLMVEPGPALRERLRDAIERVLGEAPFGQNARAFAAETAELPAIASIGL